MGVCEIVGDSVFFAVALPTLITLISSLLFGLPIGYAIHYIFEKHQDRFDNLIERHRNVRREKRNYRQEKITKRNRGGSTNGKL